MFTASKLEGTISDGDAPCFHRQCFHNILAGVTSEYITWNFNGAAPFPQASLQNVKNYLEGLNPELADKYT